MNNPKFPKNSESRGQIKNDLGSQIAEWMRVWNRILQNQPELRSLVKDAPSPPRGAGMLPRCIWVATPPLKKLVKRK